MTLATYPKEKQIDNLYEKIESLNEKKANLGEETGNA